jgi:hypothetical protein
MTRTTVRLNHAAMTVAREHLSTANIASVVSLFEECLGFRELTGWTKEGELLVVYSSARDDVTSIHDPDVSYVVLIGHDQPATANPGNMGDHVGLTLDSYDEWQGCLSRFQAAAARDDRVVVGGPEVLGSEHEREHRFYFRFLMPIAVEVQFQERLAG